MTLSDKLLEKIACPVCKGDLVYEENNERLICQTCRVAYRIVDDIPILLADEAKKL
jgi:hypothetical protein